MLAQDGRLCAGGATGEKRHGLAGARLRRALSHVGGKVRVRGGSPTVQTKLRRALEVQPDSAQAHVHGFHSYPARLHPTTAARLIEAFTQVSASVLDPFCGSGTCLTEARRLQRRAWGSDLNPLALELAWLKTGNLEPALVQRLVGDARAVFEFAEDRRLRKLGPLTKHSQATRRWFAPHVLLELDGLVHGIEQLPTVGVRRALALVLSSIVTKVSKKRSDSSRLSRAQELPSGRTLGMFTRKAKELAQRLEEYSGLLPPNAPKSKLYRRDARQLSVISDGSVELVLSSPPYPGVFDYLDHHRLRLNLLGMDSGDFRNREIGARRNYEQLNHQAAVDRWRSELLPCLAQIGRVLRPGHHAVLVIADTVVGGRALRADEQLSEWAPQASLRLVACASQERPSFHHASDRVFRGQPRSEHLVLLQS